MSFIMVNWSIYQMMWWCALIVRILHIRLKYIWSYLGRFQAQLSTIGETSIHISWFGSKNSHSSVDVKCGSRCIDPRKRITDIFCKDCQKPRKKRGEDRKTAILAKELRIFSARMADMKTSSTKILENGIIDIFGWWSWQKLLVGKSPNQPLFAIP